MTDALLRVAGVLVLLVTMADLFFTVLFPASGHGPLRRPLSRLVWRSFRGPARSLHGRRRRDLLTYAGPALVALSIAVWPILLIVGWALIYYPALGSGVVASSGPTAHNWSTAFYFSGFSLTTLGTGDIVPVDGLDRWLVVIEAAVGFAVVSMVVTYFLSVYSAIVQRRTFAAALDHRTLRTGDSARLITALARGRDVTPVVEQLSSTGDFLQRVFETHQSYPVLRYFHYRQVRYSLPRILLVTLDTAALMSSALQPEQRTRFDADAAVALVDGAARELLHELLPGHADAVPREERAELSRRRYARALEEFRDAGLNLRDEDAGLAEYVRRRQEWDEPLRALAEAMLYDWAEIEPPVQQSRGRGGPGPSR